MKNKKVFLPEVLNTVISLLTSSSVTLPLLMARRVSSRSAPVEINNDQNWHWIIQSSLTKFDNSLLTANQNNEKSCVEEILTKIPKLLLCKMNECSDINSCHTCPGHSLPHFTLCYITIELSNSFVATLCKSTEAILPTIINKLQYTFNIELNTQLNVDTYKQRERLGHWYIEHACSYKQ